MQAIHAENEKLAEDEDYRDAYDDQQRQLEYEIRQSIETAKRLWKEKKGRGMDDDDFDDGDVDVEYVRD